jgi:hypothetical protein
MTILSQSDLDELYETIEKALWQSKWRITINHFNYKNQERSPYPSHKSFFLIINFHFQT